MTNLESLTWIERLEHDESLRTFLEAEIARAVIGLDTAKWQHDHDRARIATLTQQLEAAQAENAKLRRKLGKGQRLEVAS